MTSSSGSTISSYIKRFREAPPAAKEERQISARAEDFWWVQSGKSLGSQPTDVNCEGHLNDDQEDTIIDSLEESQFAEKCAQFSSLVDVQSDSEEESSFDAYVEPHRSKSDRKEKSSMDDEGAAAVATTHVFSRECLESSSRGVGNKQGYTPDSLNDDDNDVEEEEDDEEEEKYDDDDEEEYDDDNDSGGNIYLKGNSEYDDGSYEEDDDEVVEEEDYDDEEEVEEEGDFFEDRKDFDDDSSQGEEEDTTLPKSSISLSRSRGYIYGIAEGPGSHHIDSTHMLDLRAERLLKACDDILSSYDGTFQIFEVPSPAKPPLLPPQLSHATIELVDDQPNIDVHSSLTSPVFQLLSPEKKVIAVDAAVGTDDLSSRISLPYSPMSHLAGSGELDTLYVSATSLESMRDRASLESSTLRSDERSSIGQESIAEENLAAFLKTLKYVNPQEDQLSNRSNDVVGLESVKDFLSDEIVRSLWERLIAVRLEITVKSDATDNTSTYSSN